MHALDQALKSFDRGGLPWSLTSLAKLASTAPSLEAEFYSLLSKQLQRISAHDKKRNCTQCSRKATALPLWIIGMPIMECL